MAKYALIKYQEVNILITLDINHRFSPLVHQVQNVSKLPKYARGLINFEGNPSILIIIEELLNYQHNMQDNILLHSFSNLGNLSLQIPTPDIIDLGSDEIPEIQSDSNLQIPSGKFILLDETITLLFSLRGLIRFVDMEISRGLNYSWERELPSFTTYVKKSSETTGKVVTSRSEKPFMSSVDEKEYVICGIDSYNIGFEQDYTIELLATLPEISRLPDTPYYLEGLCDYTGITIPVINMRKLLALEEKKKHQLLLIVEDEGQMMAFIVDTVRIVQNLGTISALHEYPHMVKNLLFTNIIYTKNGEYIFFINFDKIYAAVYDPEFSIDWNDWRKYFSNKTDNMLTKIRRVEEEQNLKGNFNFASIIYPEINILLQVDDKYSLEYLRDVRKNKLLPAYCLGFSTIENKPTVIIDFSKFINIQDTQGEHILLFNQHGNEENYAINIPVPKMIDYTPPDMKFETAHSQSVNLISTTYAIVANEVYLRMNSDQLFGYLRKELSQVLYDKWKNTDLTWDKLLPIKPADQQSISTRSRKVEMVGYSDENTLITFELGGVTIAFEEGYFEELIPLTQVKTRIPDSSQYIDGIIFYNDKNIPIINLTKIFDIRSEKTYEMVMILKLEDGLFGIILENENFQKISRSDYKQMNKRLNYSLLIGSILSNDKEVLYMLNLEELSNWVYREQQYDADSWRELLTVPKAYFEENTQIERDITLFKNHIAIKVPEYTFITELKDILQIRGTDARETVNVDGVTFVNFENQWIPSVEIFSKLENPLSIVVKNDNFIVEIVSNYVYFEDVSKEAISEKVMNQLFAFENYYGLKRAYIIENGVAFEFNLKNLAQNVLKMDIKKLNMMKKKITQPVPEKEEELDSMLRIWQEDIELVMLITDKSENKRAIRINNVNNIALETDQEYIPWEETNEDTYVYLSIKEGKKDVIYQIPTNCQLRGIIKGQKSKEIEIENEKIKIIKLTR